MIPCAELSVEEFTKALSSGAPTPGGGAAAALNGALGVSLTRMVAELTIGKEKYAEHEELMRSISASAESLRLAFLRAADEDAEAFGAVSGIYSMPKKTPEEKAHRKEAMQDALKTAAIVPLSMMKICAEAITLTRAATGRSNVNAVSDLGAAALSLKAAMQTAWLNVLINLSGIKDTDFTGLYKAEGERLLAEALPDADEIIRFIEGFC